MMPIGNVSWVCPVLLAVLQACAGEIGGGAGTDASTADAPASSVAFTSPPEGQRTTGTQVSFQGTCLDGESVELSGAGLASSQRVNCSLGAFESSVTLSEGFGSKEVIAKQGARPAATRSVYLHETCSVAGSATTLLTTVQAEAAELKVGGAVAGTRWRFAGPGRVGFTYNFPRDGLYVFKVAMSGTKGATDTFLPKVIVTVDGAFMGEMATEANGAAVVRSTDAPAALGGRTSYSKVFAGERLVEVTFINPYPIGANTRVLSLDYVEVHDANKDCHTPPSFAGEIGSARVLGSRHDLMIGAAAKATPLAADAAYADLLSKEYSLMTPETEFKPEFVSIAQDQYNFETTDRMVQFAKQHAMAVRGHTLVWHQALPRWLLGANFNRAQAIAWLEGYIDTVMKRYSTDVLIWDVVNEALFGGGNMRTSYWLSTIGTDYVDIAFRAARRANPQAKLFYNDFWIIQENEKTAAVASFLADMKTRNVPVDGIGMQVHIQDQSILTLKTAHDNIQRFADLGLEIHITEMDVALDKPVDASQLRKQATIYETVLRACLMVPRCTAFTTWGFTDRHSARNSATLGSALPFDENLQPKPAYRSIAEVLYFDP
jgi:endo-1,4-beta-xylanase